ncbi:MAG: alpha-ketoglutarate-dependent dioxygenase AlkB [Bacteroidetes bacterium]|nr:alpha-ketoglutarate-dependent dioxygenase AlkB [Bacteroidota bacterium]
MNLFSEHADAGFNLLPADGIVNYYGAVCSRQQADHYFKTLLNTIEWKNDEAFIFGKHYITKRKVAWYADRSIEYSYSNITRSSLPWTATLLELKKIAEEKTMETYNSCLLNLYHTGDEGMAWHSDDEPSLEPHGAIASLSFGAERIFKFKHKQTNEVVSTFLEHGSLLVMKGATQENWLHRLPKTTKVNSPRINLTFRKMLS